jgi:hypothetical protein
MAPTAKVPTTGCLTNNFPLNYCDPKTTLGIYIKYSCSNKLNNIIDNF